MKKVIFISLISAGLLLAICCNSKKKVTDPGSKGPDFALQVKPQTQWVTAGESAEYQIKLASLNGFSAPCTLSVVGFPEGDSMALDSKILVPPDSTRLTIYTTFSTPHETTVTDYYPLAIENSWTYAILDYNGQNRWTSTYTIDDTVTINGNYDLVITGKSGKISHGDTVTLAVPFGFGYLFGDRGFLYIKGDTIFSKSGEIILAGPLVIGQSWTAQSWNYELIEFGAVTLTDGTEYENCIKLKKTDPAFPRAWEYEWWAKDVGQVKLDTYAYGQYEGSMELVDFILH
jgi:hypothetical protein